MKKSIINNDLVNNNNQVEVTTYLYSYQRMSEREYIDNKFQKKKKIN